MPQSAREFKTEDTANPDRGGKPLFPRRKGFAQTKGNAIMTKIFRTSLLGAALAFSALPLIAVHANAKSSFMQDCSARWNAAKAAGTVAAGTKWPDFMKTQCATNTGQTSAQPAPARPVKPVKVSKKKVVAPVDTTGNAVPAEPTNTNYDTAVKTVHKNGKPFTPGQIAAHQRIKQCAGEWHAAKTADTLPAGEKWPQFWSACNTRLKG